MVEAHCFLWISVVISSITGILPTSSDKFSFRKTFKTPNEAYESNIAHLDKLEIVERSNFRSEESSEKNPTDETAPKAVANALVNLRINNPVGAKPTTDNTKTCCYLPYYPTCCANACNPQATNKNDGTKPCTINIINVFPQPERQPRPGKVPHLRVFAPNADETVNLNKTETSKLSADDLDVLEQILNSGVLKTSVKSDKNDMGLLTPLPIHPRIHAAAAHQDHNRNILFAKEKPGRCPYCSRFDGAPKEEPIYVLQNDPRTMY